MKELKAGEEPRAICYLHEEGNDNHVLELTNVRLIATVNKRESEIYVDTIRRLEFNHRKQILLVIYGGVIVPLAAVALFGNLFNPIILLILVFSGLFAFYIGWTGNWVLSINLISGHQDISIPAVSNNLTEFVDFTNNMLNKTDPQNLLFYYLLPKGQNLDQAVDLLTSGGKFKVYTSEMVKKRMAEKLVHPDHLQIGINPFRAGIQIKFEKIGEHGTMMPFINGKLRPDSLEESGTVSDIIK